MSAVLKDRSKAEEVLPTQPGFFFGSLEYDDYYFEDVKAEHETFSKALESVEEDGGVLYWCWY